MFLELKDVCKFYGDKKNRTQVLKNVSLNVEKGAICGIVGPSGSGKSTLLNLIGGIERADSGSLMIENEDIAGFSDKRLARYRRDKLGFIFQYYNLVSNLTIRENIAVCKYLSKEPLSTEKLMVQLGIAEHQKKFPHQVSGGQQQRCAIARALIKNPGLLLCDEPTGALDYHNSKELLELLEQINQTYGTTILLVTHNLAFKRMCSQVIELRDGAVEADYTVDNRLPAKAVEW